MSLAHKHAILDALMTVVDEETALEIIEYRKRMGKRYVLTERAAKTLAKNLASYADPIAAADEMMLRGWRAVKPGWIKDQPQRQNEASPDFLRLWNTYPITSTENFADAQEAFNSIPASDIELIMQAARWLKGSLPASYDPTYAEKARFIPSLARWLRERRYEAKRAIWEAHQRNSEIKKGTA